MPTRILLLDDDPGDRELVRNALADLDTPTRPITVACANVRDDTWPHGTAGSHDLILLAVRQAAPDGLAILARLHTHPHPPVLVLSAQAELHAALEILRAGAADYVCKNGDWPAELCRAVERAGHLAPPTPPRRSDARPHPGLAADLARKREIEELFVRTEEIARMKSEIVANVSHELRTPLNSVLGYAELLGDHLPAESPADARELLDALRQQALRLNAVIASVLSVERLRNAREPVVVSRFPVAALVEELRADAMILNADKNLVVTWKSPRRDVTLDHDRVKIRTIAGHLVSNAIKFTPAGSIQVTVTHTGDGGLVLEVRDTGIGIPPDARALVFDDFLQLDGSSTRRYQGLGLGLGIVKRYTALLRGTVRARATPGGGTTVRVELPPPTRRTRIDAA
jgi:signal transduction histidine kinase